MLNLEKNLNRRSYLFAACVLISLKYAVEALTLMLVSGILYSPFDYFNPLASARLQFAADAPGWLGIAWAIWSVPFLLLAPVLSIRRCRDAGLNPWLGMLAVVPIVNLPLMLALAVWPSKKAEEVAPPAPLSPYQPPTSDNLYGPAVEPSPVLASVIGLSAGAIYLVAITVICVYVVGNYGAALFFGAPLVTGAAASYVLNRYKRTTIGYTAVHASLTMLIACMMFLAFGLEGIICIVMAVPIMLPLATIGAVVGRSMTHADGQLDASADSGFLGMLLSLPLLAACERSLLPVEQYEVCSRIKIEAPAELVWREVIGFSEIESRPSWLFRLGVAYPTHATIQGTGVGAIRYCEFTTGTFVEPITRWEPPTRLSFDVTDQPDPMRELSPYRAINPPHLHGAFASQRGEFRIVRLSPNSCRLEGSTWYTLDIHPSSYWTVWTDWILHKIHFRVLNHIKSKAEGNVRGL